MSNQETGFGLPDKRLFYEHHKGKYYVIYSRGANMVFTGRINGVEDGKVLLRPHQSMEVVKGRLVQAMVDRLCRVDLTDICAEKETTEEIVKAYCRHQNKQAEKQDKAASKSK